LEIIVIGLLAFAGYKLFRHTTKAGRETVRAYVYLEGLKASGSQDGANQDADTIMRDLASDQLRNVALMAKHQLQAVHGGKQLPIIGYAYRRGMKTAMPAWYRNMAMSTPQTTALDAAYGSGSPAIKADGPQANGQPPAHDNTYKAFYQSFADEVHLLSGRSGELNIIDTPEVSEPRCAAEKASLGDRATVRLMELVNAGPFQMQAWPGRDEDKYGRKLRVLVRDGRSLGDILVSEGLARTWTGKREPWC